jgi:hypothetical protein
MVSFAAVAAAAMMIFAAERLGIGRLITTPLLAKPLEIG